MLDATARASYRPRDIAAGRDRLDGEGVVRPRGRSDWLLLSHHSGSGEIGPADHRRPAVAAARHHPVLIPPGVPHRYRARQPGWRYTWIHFRPRAHWHHWLGWPQQPHGILALDLDAPTARHWHTQLEAVADLAVHLDPHHDALAMNRLELALIELEPVLTAIRVAALDQRVARALAILDTEAARPPSLGALAKRCGCSASRLSHLFKDAIGCGPLQYAERERLRRAAQRLVASDETIVTIAEHCGYRDPLYFSARFKAHHGCSPSAWRDRQG